MKCNRFVSIISDYLDSNLPGHIRLEFELHMEQCPQCAHRLHQMEHMLLALRALGTNQSPTHCWVAVRQQIIYRGLHRTPWYRFILRPIIAAPALAVPLAIYLIIAGPAIMGTQPQAQTISAPEYSSYLTAHSNAQRLEPLSDPDLALVQAELEKASLTSDTVLR